ncbi:MAG TPA: hypothetical protein PK598_06960, partial [Thermoanaerobaculia bacterium]|nr:hypothetical protein [Thermoanaerobaculia bacterium]
MKRFPAGSKTSPVARPRGVSVAGRPSFVKRGRPDPANVEMTPLCRSTRRQRLFGLERRLDHLRFEVLGPRPDDFLVGSFQTQLEWRGDV